ncbi:hAT transposon superfamily isoform X1 [Wolffia australiana]
MVREKDACWEFCEKLDGNKVRCNFCDKILNGGISRLKHHLSRAPSKGVNPCAHVPDDVSDVVRSMVLSKEQRKEAAFPKRHRPLSSPTHQPVDVGRTIAEFFFENRLDFRAANSASYRRLAAALGGAAFRAPSPAALKSSWLETLKSEVKAKIAETECEWASTGCTIIADTCTDNKSRAWINFFVSSPSGTFFHKSVDASPSFKNSKRVSELFDSVILSVGPENVVQIIVDDAAGYLAVGGLVSHKHPSIFWSSCASRSLSSILEDFAKVEWVGRCIQRAQTATRFIYNNRWAMELAKRFTGGEEIVKTSFAKSVSSFLSLQSMVKQMARLKQMAASQEFSSSPSAREVLEDGLFWGAAEEASAVAAPLLRVMREVSGSKPATGMIYEYMAKAKEAIRACYIMEEAKREVFLEIVEERWRRQLHSPLHAAAAYLNPSLQFNPESATLLSSVKEEFHAVVDKLLPSADLRQDITSQIFKFRKAQGMFGCNLARETRSTASPGTWWEQYGDSAPGLQRVASRVLSQVCSANVLDRACCGSHPAQPEKRNRLDRETFEDLLYVHYNLKAQSRARPPDSDPLVLEELDMGSEWVEDAEPGNSAQWLDHFIFVSSRQSTSNFIGPNDLLPFNL